MKETPFSIISLGPVLKGPAGPSTGKWGEGWSQVVERVSSTAAASWSLAMCFAVCFHACKCCTAASGAQLSAIRGRGSATTRHDHCNVSGRGDHRCLSLPSLFCPVVSVLANLSELKRFCSLFPLPESCLWATGV